MRYALALTAALLLAAPAAAQAPPLPRVKFAGWTIYQPGAATKVKPGGSIRACISPGELLARGTVHGAIKRRKYVETWYRNGKRTDRFTISWAGRGRYPDSWSLSDRHGFAKGTWTLKLTRGRRLIGQESVKLTCG